MYGMTTNRKEFLKMMKLKILCDVAMQCYHLIKAMRPHIAVIENKEKACKIIDIAVLGDCR